MDKLTENKHEADGFFCDKFDTLWTTVFQSKDPSFSGGVVLNVYFLGVTDRGCAAVQHTL